MMILDASVGKITFFSRIGSELFEDYPFVVADDWDESRQLIHQGIDAASTSKYQRKPQIYQMYSLYQRASENHTSMPTPNAFSTRSTSLYDYSRSGCGGCRCLLLPSSAATGSRRKLSPRRIPLWNCIILAVPRLASAVKCRVDWGGGEEYSCHDYFQCGP